jgi:hypothetical protein
MRSLRVAEEKLTAEDAKVPRGRREIHHENASKQKARLARALELVTDTSHCFTDEPSGSPAPRW